MRWFLAVALSVGVLVASTPPALATTKVLDSYCSPTGDYCSFITKKADGTIVFSFRIFPKLIDRLEVCVTNAEGAEVGRAVTGWSTDLATEEFRSLTPNVALLEAIAKKTGGKVIRADRLNRFAMDLPRRHAPVMESWTKPFWHTPALFGFALACFVAEWGLRRWKGMP